MSQDVDVDMESLEAFGERARGGSSRTSRTRATRRLTDHELQQQIFDAGFAGIAFPKEYGGAGLTLAAPEGVLRHRRGDGAARAGRLHGVHRDDGGDAARSRFRAAEAAPPPADAPRRRGVDAAPVGAEWRIRHGGRAHPAHARRRQLHPQRLEDVELGRGAGRLRPVPGAHRLGRAEAPRALDDRGAAEGHARSHHRPDPGGHRRRRPLLHRVLRRHPAPRRESGGRGEPGLGGRAAAALPRASRDRRRRPRLRPRCGGRRRSGLRWAWCPGAHRRRRRRATP